MKFSKFWEFCSPLSKPCDRFCKICLFFEIFDKRKMTLNNLIVPRRVIELTWAMLWSFMAQIPKIFIGKIYVILKTRSVLIYLPFQHGESLYNITKYPVYIPWVIILKISSTVRIRIFIGKLMEWFLNLVFSYIK